MTIGLISDTHGFLDPAVSMHFVECDEIWHAGDIGPGVADQLRSVKPVQAVFGNIDDAVTRNTLTEDLWLEREGLLICITHIAGSPPRLNPRVRKLVRDRQPDILVCGHSHIVRANRIPYPAGSAKSSWLYLNPGAAGKQGFHHQRTLMRMELTHGWVAALEVIELGPRGALPQQEGQDAEFPDGHP